MEQVDEAIELALAAAERRAPAAGRSGQWVRHGRAVCPRARRGVEQRVPLQHPALEHLQARGTGACRAPSSSIRRKSRRRSAPPPAGPHRYSASISWPRSSLAERMTAHQGRPAPRPAGRGGPSIGSTSIRSSRAGEVLLCQPGRPPAARRAPRTRPAPAPATASRASRSCRGLGRGPPVGQRLPTAGVGAGSNRWRSSRSPLELESQRLAGGSRGAVARREAVLRSCETRICTIFGSGVGDVVAPQVVDQPVDRAPPGPASSSSSASSARCLPAVSRTGRGSQRPPRTARESESPSCLRGS